MATERIVETQNRRTLVTYRERGPRRADGIDKDRASHQFLQSTIDALSAHIAILDQNGNIIAVNEQWRRFGEENKFGIPGHGIGTNYLAVCESAVGESSEQAIAVAKGIRAIIEGARKEFRIVYRCHSPQEKRWFQLRATRFYDNGSIRLVMAHENITEIKHAEEELRGMTDQFLRLQDEERARIASDLHDVTAQNIFAMTMNLARLRRLLPDLAGRAEELVAETILLGEESLQEIRTVSYVLHPPAVGGEGLVSALQMYIEGFVKRTGIQVTLAADPHRMNLPAEVQTALFRIVQESLANIIRHSGSRTARIELSKNASEVLLRVKDEGIGIPSEILDRTSGQVRSLGVGIPGMRTRLRQLGGKLTIESNGRGTTVVALVPILQGSQYDPNHVR
jgi:signal transduction histidine kinase